MSSALYILVSLLLSAKQKREMTKILCRIGTGEGEFLFDWTGAPGQSEDSTQIEIVRIIVNYM